MARKRSFDGIPVPNNWWAKAGVRAVLAVRNSAGESVSWVMRAETHFLRPVFLT